jgi:exodeoxyribonuclease VIII
MSLEAALDLPPIPPQTTGQLVEGMDIGEYHDHPAIGASSLKYFLKCPEAYRYEMLDPERAEERKEEKMHFIIGTAFHTLCLEPKLFEQRFHIIGDELRKDERTAAYKQEIALANGREILKAKEISDVKKMAKAVGRNTEAMAYLKKPGIIEASLFWTDPLTGLECRARPDLILPDDDIIINFKSAADASEEAFSKQVWNLGYDIGVDHYAEGYYHVFGRSLKSYIYIVAEKSAPFLTAVYPASEATQIAGQIRRRKLMDTLSHCLKNNYWPGLNDGKAKPINIPGWASKSLENQGATQ